MSALKVINPGMLSLLQDAGRFGKNGLGLTTGGPMDPLAYRWANQLCGNTDTATAVEVSVGGLQLEAQLECYFCVTGAELPLTVNGQARELWTTHRVKSGDKIELGFATAGCRAYLAVAGGFDVAPSFGSTATVMREGIGGLDGGKLNAGDLLPCSVAGLTQSVQLAEADRPIYHNHVNLRVVPGYQQYSFDSHQTAMFYSSEYRVSERCDRMGYRLEGYKVQSSLAGMLSEGICFGAIQIPADGQPIVLLNDRQTIGGYPKIGSVIAEDAAALAQLMPGATVSFEQISIEGAHNLRHLAEARFRRTQLQAV